jgi:hypothetical protein
MEYKIIILLTDVFSQSSGVLVLRDTVCVYTHKRRSAKVRFGFQLGILNGKSWVGLGFGKGRTKETHLKTVDSVPEAELCCSSLWIPKKNFSNYSIILQNKYEYIRKRNSFGC